MKSLTFLGLLIAAVVFTTAPAIAANSITVTNQAALEGNFGAQVNIDPTDNTTETRVVSNHPDGEVTYNFSFRIHPKTLDMDVSDGNMKYFLVGSISSTNHAPAHFLFLYLLKSENSFWRLQINARQDNATFNGWQTAIPICDAANPDGPVGCNTLADAPILIEWKASDGPGVNNGFIRGSRSWDNGATYSPFIDIQGLDNDMYTVDSAWFGAIFMTNAGLNGPGFNTGGWYAFDSFVSYR